MIIKNLFEEAERIIADESILNRSEDFQRQYEIIHSRKWDRVTSEPDIINSLFVQAASYSVVRKYFKILYPEDIWLLDKHYGTRFFKPKLVPKLNYDEWVDAVLTWGNVLLKEEHVPQAKTLESLVSQLKKARGDDWNSYSKKPRSRIILSLATALPIIKKEVLNNPSAFLDKLDALSTNNPGKAFNYAATCSKGVIGMGDALVCNFLKELGLLYYVKVDVHVSDFMDTIALCNKLNNKDAFIMSWLLAREAGIKPFFLDKILYVGGKYTKPQFMRLFDRYKAQYILSINSLVSQIPEYR